MSHASQYLIETVSVAGMIDADKIEEMVREFVALRKRGGRLFVIGLGGSAANASHAVNDFRKLCDIEASTPTDNVAEFTAWANDSGWENAFDSLLDGWETRDALLVLSVGGGSPTVSAPISTIIGNAKTIQMKVFGIVGRDGGYTKKRGDCVVVIPTIEPTRVTPHTEGWQSVILHCIVSHPDLQIKATKW